VAAASSTPDDGRPRRLAYAYDPTTLAALDLAAAAEGICELVWIVDGSNPETRSMARLLRRLGPIVDRSELGFDEIARSLADAGVEGVMTHTDDTLVLAAELAQRLGLPGMTPLAAARLQDKHLQRSALRDAGVPVPDFWPVPAAGDAEAWSELARVARFPAVLKRTQGAAARGTVLVASLDEMQRAIDEIYGAAPPALLLEGFMEDRASPSAAGFASYVSIESLVTEEGVSDLAVSGRMPVAPPFRETGFFIPSALDEADRAAVLELAHAAIAALGISRACLHTEVKLTPEGPRIIEVNGHVGGFVPQVLAAATGVEIVPLLMRLALGERLAFDSLLPTSGVAYLFRMQPPTTMRIVEGVDGLDGLRDDPRVDRIALNRVGQEVDWREGGHGFAVSIRGTAADHDDLHELASLIARDVVVRGR
jgi:biotin carboxylase